MIITISIKVIQTSNNTTPPSRHGDEDSGTCDFKAKRKIILLFVSWEEKLGIVTWPFVFKLFPLIDYIKFIAGNNHQPEVTLE